MSIFALFLNSCIITDDIEAEDLDTSNTGLELYINFDNQTATDNSGNGYNGILGGTRFVTSTPKGSGYAYNIVETDDLLIVPFNPLAGLTEYSICFWIKDPSQGLLMNAYGYSGNSSNQNFPVLRISDDLFYSSFSGYSINDYFNYKPSSVLQDGNWHFLVVTVNQELQELYVDGSRVATQQEGVGGSASSELYFGGTLYGYAGALMKIDNIRLYNRSITSQEIGLIYKAEK